MFLSVIYLLGTTLSRLASQLPRPADHQVHSMLAAEFCWEGRGADESSIAGSLGSQVGEPHAHEEMLGDPGESEK